MTALADVIERGAVGSRPAAGTEGRLYYATDEDTLYRDSGSAWEVMQALHTIDETAAPDADNDVDEGFSVGSIWIDVTNDAAYICLDATDGAAVWTEITQAGGGGGAPTDVEYIVGSADGALSAEVVKQYLADNYDLDVYPVSPDTLDDEFEGGGALDVKWTVTNDPSDPDNVNQADYEGFLHVGLAELGTDNFDNLIRVHQTPPTGTQAITVIAKVAIAMQGVPTDEGEWAGVAVYFGNSANDEAVAAGVEINNAHSENMASFAAGFNDNGSGGMGGIALPYQLMTPSMPVYIKLEKTDANAYTSANTYKMYYSLNGIIWQQVAYVSKTFTTACDEIGIYFRRPKSQTGDAKGYAIVDFFRRIV